MPAKTRIFPEPIMNLPEADIPIKGLANSRLAQGSTYQIVFMEFDHDTVVPEHSHESQWGIVLKGKIDLTVEGKTTTFKQGDNYFIEKGQKHSAKIHAGYSDLTFFNQKDRYKAKEL